MLPCLVLNFKCNSVLKILFFFIPDITCSHSQNLSEHFHKLLLRLTTLYDSLCALRSIDLNSQGIKLSFSISYVLSLIVVMQFLLFII